MSRGQVFTDLPQTRVGSNMFDLSHSVKQSFKMGTLTPHLALEVVPGDKIRIKPETLIRFSPLLAPSMVDVKVTQHYFFVPYRLIWENFTEWITGNVEAEAPYLQSIESQPVTEGSILDYLGVPPGLGYGAYDNSKLSALPYYAYYFIWYNYYRDQNLQDTYTWSPAVDGPNYVSLNAEPYPRAWNHDYFTSCLPWPQKGDSVQIPLFDDGRLDVQYDNTNHATIINRTTGNPLTGSANPLYSNASGLFVTQSATPIGFDPSGSLYVAPADEASTINSLRRAIKLQEWLELNARGGTRYIENIMAHFGVASSDKRLQRPEYIGGAKSQMVISEVLSTAETTNDSLLTPVGKMAGHGINATSGNSMDFFVEEHGIIMGIINVQPSSGYFQGIERMWKRETPLDYYWPSFANIGEQAVLNQEIYFKGIPGTNEGEDYATFGYIPRYSEYKYKNNRIAGEMRSSLLYWHLDREFETAPALNEEFIQCRPSKRIFAVEDENVDEIYAHIYHDIKAIRKMPKYGIPTI